MFIVASATKEHLHGKQMSCSGDLPEALDKMIGSMLDRATERAAANGRKTVRPEDL